ncbi:hypothetical protein COO60DRAFT_1698624 [Scenedesmus sp. NREL 46B-D3]|nr:hypothetical protein COO60DRAFT_1698624 [Scenedesmus sp. NREL 46B-D3]
MRHMYITSGGCSSSDGVRGDVSAQLLLHLPHDLFARGVAQFLSLEDKRCLRQASRQLVNAATHTCVLDASCDMTLVAAQQVPRSFPLLSHMHIVNNAGAAAAAAAASQALEHQLPGLLQQLCSLSYDGPADRRTPGLDITAALAAVAAEAATEHGSIISSDAQPAASALEHMQLEHACDVQQAQQQQQQQQQQQHLTRLELRAGRLPDSLVEVVGRISSLRSLRLTATTAIATAPLAQLQWLSQLSMTVTPPLMGALAPLAALRQLAVLHLAAISPARGWGMAFQLLKGCGLQELQLVFADVSDADIAALTALTSLTHVDLHCSRHLTTACVQHLAQLRRLSVLHLAHTGLQLGPSEMLLLGGGCPLLTQLHAEFDLRGMPEPSGESRLGRLSLGHGLGLSSVLQQQLALQDERKQQCVDMPQQQLQQLQLDVLGPLGNEVAAVLTSRGRQLTALQVSGCSSMGVQGCGVLAAGLQQLQQLELVDVSLPASHLVVLLQGLGRQERQPDVSHSLVLPSSSGSSSSSGSGSGSGSSSSSSGSKGLRCLKVERCRGMTDAVVSSSLSRLQHLQQLQLTACDSIHGEAALLGLVQQLPRLAVLEVVGCNGVAEPGFARRWEAAAAAQVLAAPGSRVAVQRLLWQP